MLCYLLGYIVYTIAYSHIPKKLSIAEINFNLYSLSYSQFEMDAFDLSAEDKPIFVDSFSRWKLYEFHQGVEDGSPKKDLLFVGGFTDACCKMELKAKLLWDKKNNRLLLVVHKIGLHGCAAFESKNLVLLI